MNFIDVFKFTLSFSGFSIPILTEIFIMIDSGIYGIAAAALRGFFQIVEFSSKVFSSSTTNPLTTPINAIIGRVMILAGIYALFRLSISLINILIEPSKLKNTEKTGTTIIKNVTIAVVLLLTLNFIFGKLGELQLLIIDNEVIQNIVFGTPDDGDKNPGGLAKDEDSAAKFVNQMWLLFFKKKKDAPASGSCIINYGKVADGTGNIISLVPCHYDYFDYIPIAPFVVGIVLIYHFLVYCMEVASRMLKLLILEVLAPIPIIMSIDPTQKNKISNYIKIFMQIYLQIFIRIITFYMAWAICSISLNNVRDVLGVADGEELGWFLQILLVIGVFHGAKELPKLIEDALGLKIGDGSTKAYAGALRGLVGGTAGFVGGAIAGGISSHAAGGKLGSVLGGVLGGALTGAYSGTTGGIASKNAGDNIKNMVATIGRSGTLGTGIGKAGGLFPFIGGGISNFFGGQNATNKKNAEFDKQIKDIDKSISNINQSSDLRDKIISQLEQQFSGKHDSLETMMNNNPELQKLYNYRKKVEDNKTLTVDQQTYHTGEIDKQIEAQKALISEQYRADRDKFFDEQVNLAKNGNNLDADTQLLRGMIGQYEKFNSDNGIKKDLNYKGKKGLSNEDMSQIIEYQNKKTEVEEERKTWQKSKSEISKAANAEYQKGGKGK